MTETATPEVIPCPEEISLELGSDGQIVFVSDVHLTGGGPVADFDATTELVELLTELGRHEGEKLLLFGGDIFDLLQAGDTPVEAVDRMLAEHGHAVDLYNRHSDPYDPLDTPAGNHVVQEVVNRFDLLAPVRLGGHTHRALLVPGGRGRVVADADCWIEGMVPVQASFSLPPVFAATEDPLGSRRWAGLPTASAGSAGAAPDEPAR